MNDFESAKLIDCLNSLRIPPTLLEKSDSTEEEEEVITSKIQDQYHQKVSYAGFDPYNSLVVMLAMLTRMSVTLDGRGFANFGFAFFI